eukprot:Hpha_TRINITY_DN1690_c0_g1::TRINITY_DN1690_c0_g1_i1::g.48802::m.48802
MSEATRLMTEQLEALAKLSGEGLLAADEFKWAKGNVLAAAGGQSSEFVPQLTRLAKLVSGGTLTRDEWHDAKQRVILAAGYPDARAGDAPPASPATAGSGEGNGGPQTCILVPVGPAAPAAAPAAAVKSAFPLAGVGGLGALGAAGAGSADDAIMAQIAEALALESNVRASVKSGDTQAISEALQRQRAHSGSRRSVTPPT